jgi:UDP-galactopyranose mutase
MATDWLIVGAGLTGATLAERIATVLGEDVHVVERRPHIAGNTFDERDESGLLVHRYGPHAFHTNSERVWAYLNRFTEFRFYEHRVMALVDGALVPVPFNFAGIDALLPKAEGARLKERLLAAHGRDARVPVMKLREDSDPEIRRFADFVFAKIFLGYTAKHWGLQPGDLAPSVLARVPVAIGDDDRYFTDRHQGIPAEGCTAMVARMLDHPRITVSLSTDFRLAEAGRGKARTIYTGPIDAFFDWRFGPLPYRSLRFEKTVAQKAFVQPVAQINFPNDFAYTRITEMKHITGDDIPASVLLTEYPEAHQVGVNEPYYPIPRDENQRLLDRYRHAARETDVLFRGRLGEYRYYNMDQAVASALATFDDIARARGVALPP